MALTSAFNFGGEIGTHGVPPGLGPISAQPDYKKEARRRCQGRRNSKLAQEHTGRKQAGQSPSTGLGKRGTAPYLWVRWPSPETLKSFREHALLCGLSPLKVFLSFIFCTKHSSSQSMVQKPEAAGKARLIRDPRDTAGSVSHPSHTGKMQSERNMENPLSSCPSSLHKRLTYLQAT